MKRFLLALLITLLLLLLPRGLWGQTYAALSLDPPNTIASATDFLLTVNGVGFVNGATINWNGVPLSTNFISQGQLTATINTFRLATIGAAQVSVTQSGIVTPALIFQILTPMTGVTSYQPTLFTAGSDSPITVYGSGFVDGATIFFDWFPVFTVFVDSGTLAGAVIGSNIIGNGPHTVQVYNAPVPTGLPSLLIGPALNFGSVFVGTTETQQMHVTNISPSSVTLSTPTVTGLNSADFVKTGASTCTNALVLAANGGACQVTIAFTPSVQDNEIAILNIPSTGHGSPQFVSLGGTGIPVAAPAASFSPTTLSFGNQVTATASTPIVSTFTNTGTADLTVSALTVSGANAADFALTGTCTSSIVLGQGESCSLSVVFTPSGTTTESATISITNDASGSPQLVPLTGRGIAVAAHFVTLAWTATDSSNTLGYNVYRGTATGGPYVLLTPTPIGSNAYTDSAVTHGTQYFYVVTTVGTNPPYSTVESINSNQASVTP